MVGPTRAIGEQAAGLVRAVDSWSGRRRRTVLLAGLAVGAFLLVAAGAVALLTVLPSHDARSTRDAALDAARQRTAQVLSFSPTTVDADLDRARESVTGEFGDQFRGLLSEIVDPAVRRGITTTTTVTHAGVVSVDADHVRALLYLDQAAQSASDPAPRVTHSRVDVTMQDVAGQWLIADLKNF
jgi:Mce-associated membrane protein